MQLPKYPYRTNESYLDYEFISEGPKGKIKKAVRFTKLSARIYNLGFGDVDEQSGLVSDLAVTDNGDGPKVLATVAGTVYEFFTRHPDAAVFIRGSTPARTRLYKIGISNNRHEISATFNIYGFRDSGWETFRSQSAYEAFLVTLKKT